MSVKSKPGTSSQAVGSKISLTLFCSLTRASLAKGRQGYAEWLSGCPPRGPRAASGCGGAARG